MSANNMNIHTGDATILPNSNSSATSAITITNMALILIPAIPLLKLIHSYLKWYNSPLWKIPGPSRKKKFWLFGEFFTILKEPFLSPVNRWWKEASRELTAMSITGTDSSGVSTQTNEEQYADMIHYSYLLGKHRVFIFNPDIVHKILSCPRALYASPTPRFLKGAGVDAIKEALGEYGLVQMDGKDWYRHRRIINPSFQTRLVRDCLNSVAPALVQRFIMHWREGTRNFSDSCSGSSGSSDEDAKPRREIDVATHLSAITLDIIGLTALSCNFNAIDSIEHWSKQNQNQSRSETNDGNDDSDSDCIPPVSNAMVQAISVLLTPTAKRILFTVLGLGMLDRDSLVAKKILNKLVDQVIINAKESNCDSSGSGSGSGTAKSKYAPKSLLEALLAAEEESARAGNGGSATLKYQKHLNQQELRDELKIFIFAGHETTSVWCYWCCFALSKYPDVQQKLYDDIIIICPEGQKEGGEGNRNDDPITIEMVNKMPYLDAFMKEVLRMYPPVGLIFREVAKNEIFEDTSTNCDVTIPKGTLIGIPIHLLHRHPKYWDQPDTFLPERWLKRSSTSNDDSSNMKTGKTEFPARHQCAFLPFSTGPRNCIGYQFATMEAKLILAPIVRAFVLELAPSLKNVEFQFTSLPTLKAKPDFKMCLRGR